MTAPGDLLFWRRLGARVRDARGAADLTQQQLADRAAMSRQAIGMIEAGNQAVDALHLVRLARALGTTVTALLPQDEDQR